MRPAEGAALHRRMAAALRDPGLPCPDGLHAAGGPAEAARRFAVHRNNAMTAWVGALQDTFPVLRQLLGDTCFSALARDFARAQPPASPVLAEWGDGLAGFLGTVPALAALRYLPDMARLERACVRAWQAADRPALDAVQLAARLADPARLPAARLALHPSLWLLRSRHAVASLWAAHPGGRPDDAALAAIDPDRPENALVLRSRDDELVVAALDDGAAALVERLGAGAALGAAAEGVPPDSLVHTLARLIGWGAIVHWQAPDAAPGASR